MEHNPKYWEFSVSCEEIPELNAIPKVTGPQLTWLQYLYLDGVRYVIDDK